MPDLFFKSRFRGEVFGREVKTSLNEETQQNQGCRPPSPRNILIVIRTKKWLVNIAEYIGGYTVLVSIVGPDYYALP